MIFAHLARAELQHLRNTEYAQRAVADVLLIEAEILRHAKCGLYRMQASTLGPALLRSRGFLVDHRKHLISWALPQDAWTGNTAAKMREIADAAVDNGIDHSVAIRAALFHGSDDIKIPIAEANTVGLLSAGYQISLGEKTLYVYWPPSQRHYRNYLLDKQAKNFGFLKRLMYKAFFYNYLEYK